MRRDEGLHWNPHTWTQNLLLCLLRLGCLLVMWDMYKMRVCIAQNIFDFHAASEHNEKSLKLAVNKSYSLLTNKRTKILFIAWKLISFIRFKNLQGWCWCLMMTAGFFASKWSSTCLLKIMVLCGWLISFVTKVCWRWTSWQLVELDIELGWPFFALTHLHFVSFCMRKCFIF